MCICCRCSDEREYGPGLIQCGACGHVWADIALDSAAWDRLYSTAYFQGGEYIDYECEMPALRRNFRRQLRRLVRRHPEGGRLLEVGCAYGYFLDLAQEFFEVAGIDCSEHAVSAARARHGDKVLCGRLPDWSGPAGFDVVCLWDTIEHLDAPERYVETIAHLLRPRGTLALSTGDIGSWVARRRGMRWRQIHPPTHAHYFTERSMRALLEQYGFRDIAIRHDPFWRMADSIAIKMAGDTGGLSLQRLLRACGRAGVLRFPVPMQTFDLMTVYAYR